MLFFTQSCPTLCNSMDCSLPGSSVHEILQARVLERVVMPFSRRSSQLRDQICLFYVSCILKCVYIYKHTNGIHYCYCSVAQSCPTLCDHMDCSMPGFLALHCLPEFTQTHVHWVSDATQLSHPLSSPSPPVLSLSQYHSLFQWVSSSHQVVKVLEFQL